MVEIGPSLISAVEQEERWNAHLQRLEVMRRDFPRAKAEGQQNLAPYDAFDLLAALQISFTQEMPRGKAPKLHGIPAAAELLALFLVERGRREPLLERQSSDAEFAAALEQFGAFVDQLLTITPDVLAPTPVPADKSSEGALRRIRNQMISHHLLSPLNEINAQVDESTADLFGHHQVQEHLERELQIDARAALRLTDAVGELTVEGYKAAVVDRETAQDWRRHGERLSFTVAALAERAGVPLEQARSYAQRFSLTFDGAPLSFAELTTRARRRPLLRDDERLLPISIPVLRRSLRSSLAALLNPDIPAAGNGNKEAFTIFTTERGAWLERKGMTVLADTLRPDWTQLNVHFRLDDGRRGEIDGLLKIGDALLIVQAKSGVTRIDAEAANEARFRETLVSMLGGENLRQHRDAIEALTSEDAQLTLDPAGDLPFRRDLSGIRRVLPLHITLDDLSGVGAQPWHLTAAGISEDRDLPWIVGIGHLELLLQYFEIPALFLHFLTRRLRANLTGQLLAYDEIDWAVRYGEDQLLWAELPPDHPKTKREFMVLEEHDEFDRWVMAREAGERGKRPRPRLSSALRRLLALLDRSRPPGWLGFSLALLDLPDHGRREVVKLWQHQMRSDRRMRSIPYHVTFGAEEQVKIGFTAMREEQRRHPRGEEVLRDFCLQKMEETGAPRWAGIVAPFEQDGPVPWCCSLGESSVRT